MLLFYETWFIILMLVICPPVGIILMVRNSFWEKKTQILAGIASVLLFTIILVVTIMLVKSHANDTVQPNEPETTPSQTEEVTEPPDTTAPDVSPVETQSPGDTKTPEETTNPDKEDSNNEEQNPGEPTAPSETTNPIETNPAPSDEPATPTPSEESTVEVGKKENYTLTEDQINELSNDEKYLYLLGREFYIDNMLKYDFSLKPVTQTKYDLTIEKKESDGKEISAELKTICEKIYSLGYKSKTMQIVLKIGDEIATINDFSSEILPQINCSVFENRHITKKTITINVN